MTGVPFPQPDTDIGSPCSFSPSVVGSSPASVPQQPTTAVSSQSYEDTATNRHADTDTLRETEVADDMPP